MRRREIGIRLAVGATQRDVFRLIAGSGARLIGAGVVVGLLLSIGVGIGLQSLLIGIKPIGPSHLCGCDRRADDRRRCRVSAAGASSGSGRSGHDTSRGIT